jgi:hypothetical protein
VIVFNTLGLGMVIGSVALAYGFAAILWALGLNVGEGVVPVIAGPLMVIWDLVYRRQRATEYSNWWYYPHLGGHIVFAPIWVIGLLCLVLGGAAFLA